MELWEGNLAVNTPVSLKCLPHVLPPLNLMSKDESSFTTEEQKCQELHVEDTFTRDLISLSL